MTIASQTTIIPKAIAKVSYRDITVAMVNIHIAPKTNIALIYSWALERTIKNAAIDKNMADINLKRVMGTLIGSSGKNIASTAETMPK